METTLSLLIGGGLGLFIGAQLFLQPPPHVTVIQIEPDEPASGSFIEFLAVFGLATLAVLLLFG
jgi:hypothetical protein